MEATQVERKEMGSDRGLRTSEERKISSHQRVIRLCDAHCTVFTANFR